jgi:hypothetical protein
VELNSEFVAFLALVDAGEESIILLFSFAAAEHYLDSILKHQFNESALEWPYLLVMAVEWSIDGLLLTSINHGFNCASTMKS